jgi:thioredoxin-like negative regulator of GroEL
MIELLFFLGEDCGVCKVLKPKLLDEVSSNFPEVVMKVINTNNQMEFAAQHLVFSVPVVIIMVDKKESYRFARSFSVYEVTQKLERIIQLQNPETFFYVIASHTFSVMWQSVSDDEIATTFLKSLAMTFGLY